MSKQILANVLANEPMLSVFLSQSPNNASEEAQRVKDSPAEGRGATPTQPSIASNSQDGLSPTQPTATSSPTPSSPSSSRRTTVVDITGTDEEFDDVHEQSNESDAPSRKRMKREFDSFYFPWSSVLNIPSPLSVFNLQEVTIEGGILQASTQSRG
jgi:hypothetical protein